MQCLQNAVFQCSHIASTCFNKFPDHKVSHNPQFTWMAICLFNRLQKIQTEITYAGGGEVLFLDFLAGLTKHLNSFKMGVNHRVPLLSRFITEN